MKLVKKMVIVLLFLFIVCFVNAEEEIFLYKGSTTTATQFPLKIKYLGKIDAQNTLEVEHLEDPECEKEEVIVSTEPSSYICKEAGYIFELVSVESNMITFSVKEGAATGDGEAQIDCANDFDCFIEASKDCESAKVLHTVTIDFLGVINTGTVFMELKGVEADKCVYYEKKESISVEFSDELIQQMLDSGLTQEEIDQQEQLANENAQQTIGMEKICKFNQEDLTAMLNRWKQGSFSTEDFDVAECEEEGPVVEEPKPKPKPEPVKKEMVSLCDGCMIGDACVEEGVQKSEYAGGPLYYCGPDHKKELTKDIGDICMADYECASYLCNQGRCDVEMEKGKGTTGILVVVSVAVIIILVVVMLFMFKFRKGFKKISEEEKKMDKEVQRKKPSWKPSVRGMKQRPYRYRPEFDVLEKKMREKFK